MDEHTMQFIWPCSWNWCPETFRKKADLIMHLHGTHFNNIIKVKKRDWDAYLRSTEGRSGATDSLLGANLAYPSTSSTQSAAHNDESGSSASSGQRSPPPTTPPPRYPPLPRNFRSSRSHSNASSHTPPLSNPSPMLPPALPASAVRGPSPAKRRRTSFASCNAQSSPMSTSSVHSVPPSPALSSMIADAINRAGQINQQSPFNPHSAAGRLALAAMQGPVHVMSRRTSMGTSPSPLSQGVGAASTVPRPVSPTRRGVNPNSPGSGSVGSAQAVEDALTQNLSSRSSSASRTGSGTNKATRGQPVPQTFTQTSQSSPHAHNSSHSQLSNLQQSYCGSHAVESNPAFADSSSLPQVHVETDLEPAPISNQPLANPPLPRTLRARSRASADTQLSQAAAPVTRTLRSRSKTPVPAPSQTLPLPRRINRSRGPSVSNATLQPRAGSKPPSTRRAGSKQPRAQPATQCGASGASVLPALDERPEEDREALAVDAGNRTSGPQQPAFRSGKLQLPRRMRPTPNAQSQLHPPKQPQIQPTLERSHSDDVPVSIKTEPKDVDTMGTNIDPQSQTAPGESQSQSQGTGGYREGYGFDLGGIQLMTQRPYPSQSQEWSQ